MEKIETLMVVLVWSPQWFVYEGGVGQILLRNCIT